MEVAFSRPMRPNNMSRGADGGSVALFYVYRHELVGSEGATLKGEKQSSFVFQERGLFDFL